MSKKRNETKNTITVKEANLNAGITIINRHPLFSQLHGYKEIQTGKQLGRSCAAIVNSNGYILLNKDVLLTPEMQNLLKPFVTERLGKPLDKKLRENKGYWESRKKYHVQMEQIGRAHV